MPKDLIMPLLEEFKYRHDHFWKILFRFSSAMLVLYSIPVLDIKIKRDISDIIYAFPSIGLIIAAAGIFLLNLEFKMIAHVEKNLNKCKEIIVEGTSNDNVTSSKKYLMKGK